MVGPFISSSNTNPFVPDLFYMKPLYTCAHINIKPGQVKTKQSTDVVGPHKPGVQDVHDHDMSSTNRNIQHSHALRLALGSILTPKRPYSPSSRPQSKSSSGSSSPALSYSFSSAPSSSVATPSLPPTPPQPPPPTPIPMHQYLHNLQHAHAHTPLHHMHQLSHVHTPSRLGMPEHGDYMSAKGDTSPVVPSTTTQSAFNVPSAAAQQEPHAQAGATVHGERDIHSQTSSAPDGSAPVPRARYIETLQSKSAWDALIHGSFS